MIGSGFGGGSLLALKRAERAGPDPRPTQRYKRLISPASAACVDLQKLRMFWLAGLVLGETHLPSVRRAALPSSQNLALPPRGTGIPVCEAQYVPVLELRSAYLWFENFYGNAQGVNAGQPPLQTPDPFARP